MASTSSRSRPACSPALESARTLFRQHASAGHDTLPISYSLPAPDTLTPVIAYLRLTEGARSSESSFLLESVLPGSTQGRFSFLGCDPSNTLSLDSDSGDPLLPLESELAGYNLIPLPASSSHLSPPFKGGAVGYVAYDCIYAFERVLASHRPKFDELGIPDAFFVICDTIVVFDHLFGSVAVWSHLRIKDNATVHDDTKFDKAYNAAVDRIARIANRLAQSDIPLPEQPKISKPYPKAVSNVGEEGYKGFVRKLRDQHIVAGDIIQAVPSQRLSRKTQLHPFNAYRYLRQLNPSPYMFYVDCKIPSSPPVQLVGASPECLLSITSSRIVTNHAIAGTIKRGLTTEEDEKLANELLASIKDRAEHVMLVDLARNDINRVCKPKSVKVVELMKVEKFSHVMHLTSTVEGELRDGLTRFDAFRSIFPAGTVSGAPKIKAMELISTMEPSTRGVYAGAVGRFNLGSRTSECDTCIAIRTMLFKDGKVYLQAGGGIVWDSEEQAEYQETVDKLSANVRALEKAEDYYSNLMEMEEDREVAARMAEQGAGIASI